MGSISVEPREVAHVSEPTRASLSIRVLLLLASTPTMDPHLAPRVLAERNDATIAHVR